MTAIQVRGLSKRYGAVLAVAGVDLDVAQGEIFALLGLNGAGKTTIIRSLLGMIRPTAGRVALLGELVTASGRGPWRRVGHLVEAASAYPELTVRENLDIARLLHGITDAGATGRTIERFGLAPYADRRARALSLGNLQRLALARALLHETELVVLDEPANGLDPAGVVEIRELLLALAVERGSTVFISSHLLAEVDRLATRIGIMREGQLVELVDVRELEGRSRRLVVDARDRAAARAALERVGYTAVGVAQDGALALDDLRAVNAPDEVARILVTAGASPIRLSVEQEDLEKHFLQRVTGAR